MVLQMRSMEAKHSGSDAMAQTNRAKWRKPCDEGEEMRDTINMAREAGIELDLIDENEGQIWYITTEGIKAFEALVRADAIADEREACAKVCDDFEVDAHDNNDLIYRECATTIRARGNT